jgi:hypothetical protein
MMAVHVFEVSEDVNIRNVLWLKPLDWFPPSLQSVTPPSNPPPFYPNPYNPRFASCFATAADVADKKWRSRTYGKVKVGQMVLNAWLDEE